MGGVGAWKEVRLGGHRQELRKGRRPLKGWGEDGHQLHWRSHYSGRPRLPGLGYSKHRPGHPCGGHAANLTRPMKLSQFHVRAASGLESSEA